MYPYIAIQTFIALLLVMNVLTPCRETKFLAPVQKSVVQLANALIIALVSLFVFCMLVRFDLCT